MNRLLRANLRSHARRYIATGLAVAISTAFVLAFLALGNGMNAVLERITASEYEGASVIVSPGDDFSTITADGQDALKALIPRIERVEGVGAIAPVSSAYLLLAKDGTRSNLMVQALMPTPFSAPTPSTGSLPSSPGQIALDEVSASRLGVSVGDPLEIAPAFAENPSPGTFTVSALLPHSTLGPESAVMTPQGLDAAAHGESSTNRLLIASSAASPSNAELKALSKSVAAVLADQDLEVKTADEAREQALKDLAAGSTGIQVVLLVFPIISVVVASIVVASTFRVLLTQRTRELALLRAVGTTRRQIRSLLLREALLVGLVSSAIGVLLGLLIGWGVLTGFGFLGAAEALKAVVSPSRIIGAFALGTLMTLLASLRPALAMGRLTPMEALANAEAERIGSARSHRILLTVSLLVAALGAAGMAYGLQNRGSESSFLIAFSSGMVILVAMMVAGVGIVPLLARAWGALARGTTGRLARGNALRNPGRTASTGIAIAIGVTLITMMSVGASSTKATLETEVYAHYPYDLNVSTPSGALSEAELARIQHLEGVDAAIGVRGATGTIESTNATSSGAQDLAAADPDSFVSMQGLPDLNPVAHAPVEAIPDSIVRVSSDLAGDGDTMRVCAEGGSCADFTAEAKEKIPYGQIQLSATSLKRIAPDAPISTIVVKTGSEDVEGLQSRLLSLDPSYMVFGPALERQTYTKTIDAILAIVVGLLAVSVLVALVGVTNTLGLSVAERTRENGLLRALGTTKRRIQRMLALEALIIALAGSTLGLLLGVGFGIAGTYALPFEEIDRTIISIPWPILGAVVAGSILAALAASWWPGRRAAKTSPVEALATE